MALSRRVRVSSKGQLVIPLEMRQALGLEAGDELVLHQLSGNLLLAEVPEPSPFQQAAARLRQQARDRGITRRDVARSVREARQESHHAGRSGRPKA